MPTRPHAPSPAIVEAEPTPIDASQADEWFLGFVSQTGIEHCVRESEPTWLAVRSTLGFIPTSGLSLDPWMAKPVLAKGRSIPAPSLDLPFEPTPCPMMQMRGDWVSTPAGLRIDHGTHPNIEHFQVASAEPLTLTLVREADEFVVEFQNPLPFALAELTLVVHYEGCGGKPGSTTRSAPPQPLASGETRTERFPILIDQPPPPGARKGGPTASQHKADSLQITAQPTPTAPPLHIDLDIPIASLALTLDCPHD